MKTCYECDVEVHELSPRSRCVRCEYRRAMFNEHENNELSSKLAEKQIEYLHSRIENLKTCVTMLVVDLEPLVLGIKSSQALIDEITSDSKLELMTDYNELNSKLAEKQIESNADNNP